MKRRILAPALIAISSILLFYAVHAVDGHLQANRKNRIRSVNLLPALQRLEGWENKKGCCELYVINIWEDWCKPCIEEIPRLNTLKSRYAASQVAFIALTRFPEMALTALQEKHQLHFNFDHFPIFEPVYADPFFAPDDQAEKIIPTTILLDHRGFILEYFTGYDPEQLDIIKQHIDEAILD